jgi:hypothetical protein
MQVISIHRLCGAELGKGSTNVLGIAAERISILFKQRECLPPSSLALSPRSPLRSPAPLLEMQQ